MGQNFYWSYGDIFPTSIRGTGQGPLVDLRYQVAFSNSITGPNPLEAPGQQTIELKMDQWLVEVGYSFGF